MSISRNFQIAATAERVGSKLFLAVTAISSVLLVFPREEVESWLHPLLIVAAFAAVTCSVVTMNYQTEGNRLLRATQLSNSLGATIGDAPRQDYFNNSVPPSFLRLAATTLENTLFSKEVLSRMLVTERAKVGAYAVILILLLSLRWTSTSWLLLTAQTIFSADLILAWIRMERFRQKTVRVHECIRQFFLQQGDAKKPNNVAIIVASFTDYECAKDEASVPLDSAVFEKLNAQVSERWEVMKAQLQVLSPLK
ncbi:MAG: hypothetical protein V4697_00950 [Patescibacteria group bacterium]